MKDREFDSGDLRESFLSAPDGTESGRSCPPSEQFLMAVLGELSVAENRSLADHGAVCPSCSVTWKLAREYARETGLAAAKPTSDVMNRSASSLVRRRWMPAAVGLAAALALLAVFLPWRSERPREEPVLRALDAVAIESRTPEDAPLAGDRFTLRWSAGPAGASYNLRVTDYRLNPIARAVSLDVPEFTVPATSLKELEPGGLVLWQVETVLPNGRHVVSRTFANHLE